MHYKLVFTNDSGDAIKIDRPKVVEFEAVDAAAALIYAHKESPDQSAELWSGGRKLCRIRRIPVSEEDLWEILSATA